MTDQWYVKNIDISSGETHRWGPFPSRRVAKRWARTNWLTSTWVEKETPPSMPPAPPAPPEVWVVRR